MRTFRLIGMTLLMVILAVNFTACSDEEEEEQTIIEQANLIGKWQSTWEKIHKVENGKEVVTSDEAYTNALLEFKADGTCIESRVEGGYTETSRWSLKDNKLTLSYSDGYSDVLTINELTATKLVLAFEDWDNLDDGSLELDDITTTTYKKID
ncbi:lipocalin family protein [Bacteroides sp. HPS0048]|uniref:lipocalin family protein n=1 Tax=Bacteroides sp. HPS0048 TaxID=1078089 RepID=UPI003562C347